MAKKAVVETVVSEVAQPGVAFVRSGRSAAKASGNPTREWGMLCELLEGVATECQQRDVMPGVIVVKKAGDRTDEWLEAEVRK